MRHYALAPTLVAIAATLTLAALTAGSALASHAGGAPPTPFACGQTFKTSTIRASFSLPLSVTLPARWCAVTGGAPGTFGLIHVGSPASDDRQWWGPDVILVDGARVHRPSDAASGTPATADATKFMPWPADFFRYLSGLSGVKVLAGPKLIIVGGHRGTQIVVATPRMHPLLWLKNDFTWLGGGATGIDPPGKRQLILLTVGKQKLLLSFGDAPGTFAPRAALLQPIYRSITFGAG